MVFSFDNSILEPSQFIFIYQLLITSILTLILCAKLLDLNSTLKKANMNKERIPNGFVKVSILSLGIGYFLTLLIAVVLPSLFVIAVPIESYIYFTLLFIIGYTIQGHLFKLVSMTLLDKLLDSSTSYNKDINSIEEKVQSMPTKDRLDEMVRASQGKNSNNKENDMW